MSATSLDEIRGQVSAGSYAIDSKAVAADLLTKAALIRKVKPMLLGEDEQRSPAESGRATRPRGATRPASPGRRASRRERLS
jgi:hypothetical protein